MDAAGADWQRRLPAVGRSFINQAMDTSATRLRFDERASLRAWTAMLAPLDKIS
jgi:hypothetical protein